MTLSSSSIELWGRRKSKAFLSVARVISSDMPELIAEEELMPDLERPEFGYLRSIWLKNMGFHELESEMRSFRNTKTKEIIARDWCKQHPEDPDLARAIRLWLDTVIGDPLFPISLGSLAEIANLLQDLPQDQLRGLVN